MRLYCKEGKARGQFVLQYNILYCDLGARQGWTVLPYGHCSHDTALGRGGGACRWACWAGARQAGRRRGAGGACAAGARPGRWACGLALGSALGALGPFSIRFDSFFPESHFLDIVREPGS